MSPEKPDGRESKLSKDYRKKSSQSNARDIVLTEVLNEYARFPVRSIFVTLVLAGVPSVLAHQPG